MAFWRIVHRCFLTVSQEKRNYGPRPRTTTRTAYHNTVLNILTQDSALWRGGRGQSGWSPDDLSPTFGFFLLRLLLHGTGGIITFLVLTFSAPILPDLFFSPHIFVQTSAADFYIGRIIPFFCHSSDCIGKYLAKSSLTSMLFNRRTKFKRSCSHHISSNTDGLCISFTCFHTS